jgi:hypothetical protein
MKHHLKVSYITVLENDNGTDLILFTIAGINSMVWPYDIPLHLKADAASKTGVKKALELNLDVPIKRISACGTEVIYDAK